MKWNEMCGFMALYNYWGRLASALHLIAERLASVTADTSFIVFGLTRLRIEPSLPAFKANALTQTWATYGPWAGSGPRDHFTPPAGTYKNVTLYRESSRTSFTLL